MRFFGTTIAARLELLSGRVRVQNLGRGPRRDPILI